MSSSIPRTTGRRLRPIARTTSGALRTTRLRVALTSTVGSCTQKSTMAMW